MRSKIAQLYNDQPVDSSVTIMGWVKTRRGSKKLSFVAVSDGSCLKSMQVVIDNAEHDENTIKQLTTGASVKISGNLVASQGIGQSVEIQATSVEVLGSADGEQYPLQKKKHSLEFLREIAHLRPRTNTFTSVLRIRNGVSFAIHKFFQERGFVYHHSPIITASDAEGAGEMFQVTTLPLENIPKTKAGEVDFSDDFFGKPAHLTVSGQLSGELAALALGEVYTFGPTFRAENSNTSRHIAEFWMIEPEMAFYDLNDNVQLASDFLKYVINDVLANYAEEVEFLEKTYSEGLRERLQFVLDNDFIVLEYTEGIEILKASGRKFEFPVTWGSDLQSEHERYLVEEHFKKPVVLINYPKGIKAFYMRLNDDDKTVAAMDVLFPGIGEIIGGSQREEREDVLRRRIDEMGLPIENYWWYLETRQFGSVPHSGFGLGLERLLMFVTGMENIRDVIAFPRYPGHAEF